MGSMRFKVGDHVRIKSLDWYNENKDVDGFVYCGNFVFDKYMSVFCGSVVTISWVYPYNKYDIQEDIHYRTWTDEMIEGLVEEEIIDLTSIVMETVEKKTIQNALTYGYNLPEGYQFTDENGNVINATKIVLEKKKKKYPKTYCECKDILGLWDIDDTEHGYYKTDLIDKLQMLLICRDAYWKIAGEEMGLGKPWEPDWLNDDVVKYVISHDGRTFGTRGGLNYTNYLLAFPTEEMRDAFYENFKELIEQCKELL